jgi:hypothetical protein
MHTNEYLQGSACLGKKPYTEQEAIQKALALGKTLTKGYAGYYKCNYCNMFHITKDKRADNLVGVDNIKKTKQRNRFTHSCSEGKSRLLSYLYKD